MGKAWITLQDKHQRPLPLNLKFSRNDQIFICTENNENSKKIGNINKIKNNKIEIAVEDINFN